MWRTWTTGPTSPRRCQQFLLVLLRNRHVSSYVIWRALWGECETMKRKFIEGGRALLYLGSYFENESTTEAFQLSMPEIATVDHISRLEHAQRGDSCTGERAFFKGNWTKCNKFLLTLLFCSSMTSWLDIRLQFDWAHYPEAWVAMRRLFRFPGLRRTGIPP